MKAAMMDLDRMIFLLKHPSERGANELPVDRLDVAANLERLRDVEATYKRLIEETRKLHIVNLDISYRLAQSLLREGLHTVDDLLAMTDVELLRLKNVGKSALHEIKIELQRKGLAK